MARPIALVSCICSGLTGSTGAMTVISRGENPGPTSHHNPHARAPKNTSTAFLGGKASRHAGDWAVNSSPVCGPHQHGSCSSAKNDTACGRCDRIRAAPTTDHQLTSCARILGALTHLCGSYDLLSPRRGQSQRETRRISGFSSI
jgi:hypothetical protein